ncbi:MAG: methyltransferase [Pseudomonadota bacterium]
MTEPAALALSRDKFLGGRIDIDQPRAGYRAGVDPVFLAASVPARSGQSVLELGCGAGVASLCLGARVPGLDLAAIEIQPRYADLARANAKRLDIALTVFDGDVAAPPAPLRARQFDHVLANPPYHLRSTGPAAEDAGRETGLGEGAPLQDWIDCAARRLRAGGCLTLIQRADRLPDLLSATVGRFGAIQILPLSPRAGRPANLVLMRALKGRRTPFQLRAPVTLHTGDYHQQDGDNYSPQIASVLREGAEMPGWTGADQRNKPSISKL